MKKTKRLAVIIAVLLLIVMAIPSPMHAESLLTTSLSVQAENWYYPVLPGNDEWVTMTLEEQRAACNMPEDLVKVCSTERLLMLALDNPFLSNFVSIYNETNYAINHFCRMFNIFDELFARDNFYENLLNEFRVMPIRINDDESITYEKYMTDLYAIGNYIKLRFLEKTIGVRYYSMSVELQSELLSAISDKIKNEGYYPYGIITVMERELNEIPYDFMVVEHEVIYHNIIRSDNIPNPNPGTSYSTTQFDSRFVPFDPYSTSEALNSYGQAFTYGFKGTFWLYYSYNYAELCYAALTTDYNSSVNVTIDNSFINTNSGLNLTKIHSASLKYNCHSYAWISTSSSNVYWINSLSSWPYGANLISNNGYANTGDIIVLTYGGSVLHSAIATSMASTANTIYVKAKMGEAGVYSCSLSDMMTIYGADGYYVYRK